MSITSQAKPKPRAEGGKRKAGNRDAWKCPQCGRQNPAETPTCLAPETASCSGISPQLTATERAIVNALEPTDLLHRRWLQLRSLGGANIDLCEALFAAQAANFANFASDGDWVVCWLDDGSPAQRFALWLVPAAEWRSGVHAPPDRPADVAGERLYEEIRRLWSIPTLGILEARQPEVAPQPTVQEPAAGSAKAEGGRRKADENGDRPLQEPAAGATSGSGPWSGTELALLGTKPDAELAAQFGRTTKAVAIKRQKLKIPVFLGVTQPGAFVKTAESGASRAESQKPKPQRTESERIADYKRPIADRSTTRKETTVAKKKPAAKPKAEGGQRKKPEQKATEKTEDAVLRRVVFEGEAAFDRVRVVELHEQDTGLSSFAFEMANGRNALGENWEPIDAEDIDFEKALGAVAIVPF